MPATNIDKIYLGNILLCTGSTIGPETTIGCSYTNGENLTSVSDSSVSYYSDIIVTHSRLQSIMSQSVSYYDTIDVVAGVYSNIGSSIAYDIDIYLSTTDNTLV